MLTLQIYQEITNQVREVVEKLMPKMIAEEVKKEAKRSLGTSSINSNDPFSMLKRGAINQAKNAEVSANDVYGRVVLKDFTGEFNNDSLYKNMKNKINYGKNPVNVSVNKGKFTFK